MKIFQVAERFAFADYPTPDDLDELRKWDALITLSKKHPSERVKEMFVHYRYCPIPDGKGIPVEQVEHIVAMVVPWIRAGKNVLVHCWGGRNRSGLVAARVLMELYGWDGKTAIAHVDKHSRKRNGGARALTNLYFRAYLESLS